MEVLVRYLVERGVLKSRGIVNAFRKVDRIDFVLPEDRERAYLDAPLTIGFGQTISQPTVVAFMLELLAPRRGEKILDVGAGSGWTTALLAELVGKEGKIWGVEIIPQLAEFGKRNLTKYDFPWAEIIAARARPPAPLGFLEHAPFDKILVSAAAPRAPQELLDQLKTDGIMAIPVRDAVWQVRKISGEKLDIKKFEGFAFVPLIYSE